MGTTNRRYAGRSGKGKFVRTIESAERDGQACRLRAQGATYEEIAERLGYANKSNAQRGVQRALAEAASVHGASELRALRLAELAELSRSMWDVVRDPGPLVDRVGRICHGEDGEPLPDNATRAAAASVVLKTNESLRRLEGFDAPKRSVQITASAIEAEMIELARAMGVADPVQFFRQWTARVASLPTDADGLPDVRAIPGRAEPAA